jgi:hypothetical protein
MELAGIIIFRKGKFFLSIFKLSVMADRNFISRIFVLSCKGIFCFPFTANITYRKKTHEPYTDQFAADIAGIHFCCGTCAMDSPLDYAPRIGATSACSGPFP